MKLYVTRIQILKYWTVWIPKRRAQVSLKMLSLVVEAILIGVREDESQTLQEGVVTEISVVSS